MVLTYLSLLSSSSFHHTRAFVICYLATSPVFTLPSEADGATIDISEDTDLQTSIYQISATDSDGDTILYFLTKGSSEFSLDTTTRVVKVASTLDYDTDPKSYELEFE